MQNLITDLENYFLTNKNVDGCKDFFNNIAKNNIIIDNNNFIEGKMNKKKLYTNEDFELVLIYWGKYSQTSIHKHPSNGCVLKVLDGELNEYVYKNNDININNLKTNDISYMHDNLGEHQIIPTKKSLSIHLYSPPGFYN